MFLYIGETKRSFTTRRKEHMRNIKYCTKGSNVAKHALTFNHVIDFNNSKIIDKANNRSRKTLESWHTAKTVGADSNSCPFPLPRQYHILLKNDTLRSGQNYSKMYGIEPRYNEPRYNEFLNITNVIRKLKRKIYLDITNYNVNTRQKINAEQINSQQIL